MKGGVWSDRVEQMEAIQLAHELVDAPRHEMSGTINMSELARRLGMDRTSLYRKVDRFGLLPVLSWNPPRR